MRNWKSTLFSVTFALNCSLVFLLLLETRLHIPVWLQLMGRMHPLLLHFPIVLVVLYALVFPFVSRRRENDSIVPVADTILLIAAFTSVVTALAGLFLSREEGYDPDALLWHKWGGILLSLASMIWYYFRKTLQQHKIVSVSTSAVILLLVVITGHEGADLTHGENFLTGPLYPESQQPVVDLEEAEVYAHLVRPILEAKCMSCHNSSKAKGELIMETEALLKKGGKSGPLWDSKAADLGLLLQRVHLPEEDKKHMAPKGKPQLTGEEIAIISEWIKHNADFTLKVTALPPTDTLFQLAAKRLKSAEIAGYDFEEADPATVSQLNSVNRVISREAANSPALDVSFFNSSLFDVAQLKELSPIKKQVVSLDLARMPVKDADLQNILELENLRRLNLSFTDITGATLGELKKLKHLKSLSVSGTPVTAAQLNQLKALPQLRSVYIWNTGVKPGDLATLQKELAPLRMETGFTGGDTMILQLSPPVVLNEERIITKATLLQLKHYIKGASIRYTMDGSEPDSLLSPEYKPGIEIDDNTVLHAKAFKPGWISSPVITENFYKRTYKPDTALFITQPDPSYRGSSSILTDLLTGGTNFKNGSWLGWRQAPMEMLFEFTEPVAVQNVSLNVLVEVSSYIMPPQRVEVWGGDDKNKLRLLGTVDPKQPLKEEPAFAQGVICRFTKTTVRYVKLVAKPVASLPAWHPGKGDKGWVFTDEVLIN